ncbi:MAG TPA: permease prefix domain 1-containing protein, partial [Candidatus Bathyarchaeia archaeon]|nr:permease prefix domain 1-containing protein [Candidatus Bathyarchaeia archaeon]
MRPEHWLYTIPLRLRSLFRWAQAEQELDNELRDHLERKTEEYVAQGMAQEEARRRARLELGGVEKVKEECREARRVNWIQDFLQDLRYGLRMLRKNPGFTAVAVLTLALGIGANTAMFSVVDTALLRPLIYKDPSRLVWATEHFGVSPSAVVGPDFAAWKDHNRVFEQIEAFAGAPGANLTGAGEPTRASVTNVSTGLFSMLGVQPIAGRTFLGDDGKAGHEHVAMLNETLWRT